LSNPQKNKTSTKTKFPFWFYIILILIPIIFFILLEIILRAVDYDRSDEQWIEITETKQMLNPDIAGRYFFNTKDLPQSNNDAFDINKRENTFRVFVMGGSSAQGFPFSPNGTFSRYIRDRLELLYPENHIEVINVAITATNSYTIRDLLQGVLEQKPDLIIFYAGHNEYYGSFGVGSNENIGGSRSIVNLVIWLNKFKSVQLVRNGINSIVNLFSSDLDETQRGGTLMARIVKEQSIPMNSELFNSGLEQFEGNFEEILDMTQAAAVPVIIGTLVSNLKDQKPFISIGIDPDKNADSVYINAKIQLGHGNFRIADSLFRKAKDFDVLRFRAPEKINQKLKMLANKFNYKIVNVDSILNSISPDGVIGNNLIVDHLHPSLTGYQLIGKIYFEEMLRNGYLPISEQAQISVSEQHSIVVEFFAFSRLDSMISQIRLTGLLNDWPFVDKRDFSFIKDLRLNDRIDSIAYKIAVENINWEKGHIEAAEWYLNKKDYQNFAKEYRVLVSQYPFKLSDYDYAASQLISAKQYELAYNFLLKRYKETPDAFSTKWLGNINLTNGNVDNAIIYLNKSLSFDKNDAQVYYNLAGAYVQNEEYEKALHSIEQCLSIKPDFANAKSLKSQLTKLIAQ